MLQYDIEITYIWGEDNCIADALSRFPINTYPNEKDLPIEPHALWSHKSSIPIAAILQISMDTCILNDIKKGYKEDKFWTQLSTCGMCRITQVNGLWYMGLRLIIP